LNGWPGRKAFNRKDRGELSREFAKEPALTDLDMARGLWGKSLWL
jgi:hypothetical protein